MPTQFRTLHNCNVQQKYLQYTVSIFVVPYDLRQAKKIMGDWFLKFCVHRPKAGLGSPDMYSNFPPMTSDLTASESLTLISRSLWSQSSVPILIGLICQQLRFTSKTKNPVEERKDDKHAPPRCQNWPVIRKLPQGVWNLINKDLTAIKRLLKITYIWWKCCWRELFYCRKVTLRFFAMCDLAGGKNRSRQRS